MVKIEDGTCIVCGKQNISICKDIRCCSYHCDCKYYSLKSILLEIRTGLQPSPTNKGWIEYSAINHMLEIDFYFKNNYLSIKIRPTKTSGQTFHYHKNQKEENINDRK